jgi:nucleotide-binding universal stress UspA family protein
MFKHVLIPTDGSALSRRAVKAGISFAKGMGARVTAYHAVPVIQPYIVGGAVGIAPLREFEARVRKQAERYLAEAGRAAKVAGVRFQAEIGEPATPYRGIIEAAKRRKCDVIFMASRGRGEFSSLILGSVTQKVLAHSTIPVLVYR